MILPTLRQLEFLCAIGDEGSFSRAADTCRVTQPTLSSAIKELEALLGVQLVEREARGASLTRAGQETVERARRVLSGTADLVAAARQAGEPLTGPFRLGAIPTIAPFLLPRTMNLLRERYPALKLFLREDQTERLLDDLRSRRLDAALIALPWDSPGIESEAISEDEFLLVAPEGHALLEKPQLHTADLRDQDLLLLEDGHCLREHALQVCEFSFGRLGTDVTATSLATLVHMVAGGLGVSLLPRLAVEGGVTSGIDVGLRRFDDPAMGRRLGVAWRAGSPREAEARLIGDIVKQALSD